jgi:hypothetical protein
MFTYAITNRSGAKFKKMERAGLHVIFYYYSACLHLGKTKENFSTVGVIYRDIFLTLNIVHTYSLCSILKNTDQCIVSCYATNYTEDQRF